MDELSAAQARVSQKLRGGRVWRIRRWLWWSERADRGVGVDRGEPSRIRHVAVLRSPLHGKQLHGFDQLRDERAIAHNRDLRV